MNVLAEALADESANLEVLAGFVLRAASCASSLNDARSDATEGPSRRTLNRWLETLDLSLVERSVNDELFAQAARRFPPRPIVGIDLTFVPYHGEHHEDASELKRGKAKSGTTWFHAYATAYICARNKRFTFLVHFVRKTETPTQALDFLLDEMARRGIVPYLTLADKGFATHDAVVSLKRRELSFIMPLPSKGKKTKDLQRGRGSYTTTTTLNKEPISVAIIVKRNTLPSGRRKYHGKKPGNQYFPYIVHGIRAGPKRIDALYRLRGGIESSYKLNNKARARTTSKRPAVRLFYFATSFLIQNAWIALGWRVSAPTRGQQGRVRPPGFFTLTRFLRLVRAWTEIILGLVETVTQLPSREGQR